MVFIASGMGGVRTGTGASHVIARAARGNEYSHCWSNNITIFL